jgi:hypothetical protein
MSKTITFQEIVEDAGFEARSYSGRAMYGKECLSVSLDRGDLGTFVAGVIESLHNGSDGDQETDEERHTIAADSFRVMRQDSMGMGIVLYFPGVPCVNEGSPEDEEEDNDQGHDETPEEAAAADVAKSEH